MSPRTISKLKDAAKAVTDAIAGNPMANMVDEFEKSEAGKGVFGHAGLYSYMNVIYITVPDANTIQTVLLWFRETFNYRSVKFHDYAGEHDQYREYELEDRVGEGAKFDLRVHFSGGTCEFVEVETGEMLTIPHQKGGYRKAIPAHERPATKRVLKCNGDDLPGLPDDEESVAV
jgi:hypothetical protein|tara:strand:- start:738 stop:1259 length:522 start_codon:yes stop_codon:yes gene_type:complete